MRVFSREILLLVAALPPILLNVSFGQENFKKIRQRMADSIGSTQDFVCTVNINETAKGGGSAPARVELQAQAGLINGKELYLNPPSDAEYKKLTGVLTHHGNAGTTIFGLYLRPIFLTSQPSFSPGGSEDVNGIKASRWDFTMPKESSRYTMTWNYKPIVLGFSGSYWAEPEKGDVIRMEIHPDSIPKETELKDVKQTISYTRQQIGGVSVILPTENDVVLLQNSGAEVDINSRITDCHTYISKPGVRYVEVMSDVAAAVAGSSNGGKYFPANVTLDTWLTEGIDEKTSSVGSPFTLQLGKDVKDGKTVLAKKGAKITGHVTRISRQSYRTNTATNDFYLVGLALDSIDDGSDHYNVVANLELVGPTSTIDTFLPHSQDPKKWGQYEDVREQMDFPRQARGESLIGLVRPYMRIPSKLRMVFSTTPPQ